MTLEDVRGYIKVFKRNRSLREKAREAKEEDDKIKRAKALELVREDLEDMFDTNMDLKASEDRCQLEGLRHGCCHSAINDIKCAALGPYVCSNDSWIQLLLFQVMWLSILRSSDDI
ncbi:hypothetical protein Tco_1359505 [Tanacetum coccineum]